MVACVYMWACDGLGLAAFPPPTPCKGIGVDNK